MMDQEYWNEKLQAYIDNELAPADCLAVEQRLASDPAYRAHMEYFRAMKKRLRAHANSIEIPASVDERLARLFQRKQRVRRFKWVLGPAMAIAAVAVLALLALTFRQTYQFKDNDIEGVVVCHGCEVAAKSGLNKGELCRKGHWLGLKTEDGELWRFAGDANGEDLVDDLSWVGKSVRVFGQTLTPEHLIRVKNLEPQETDPASSARLYRPSGVRGAP